MSAGQEKQTSWWPPWDWNNRTAAAALSSLGIAVAAGFVINKFRARPHDNIPSVAMEHFHPILGHLPFLIRMRRENPDGFLFKLHEKMGYPSVSSMSHLLKIVFLIHPVHIKHVFETDFEKAGRSEAMKERGYEVVGNGIFASNGEQWKFHRKVASRMFSMRNLQHYMFDTSLSNTRRLIDKLLPFSGKVVDINDILGRFTLDTFCEIAFGKNTESVASYPQKEAFGTAFDNLIEGTSGRPLDMFWKWKRRLNVGSERHIASHHAVIKGFIENIVRQKTKSSMTDESGKESYDILSLYLKHDPTLSLEDLYDVALNFIIAGRDTTRMLLSWWIWELCKPRNEGIRRRVYEEIDAFSKEPTHADIGSGFVFLEQTLCETLRLNPSVPILPRECWESIDLPRIDGEERAYRINAGDLVLVHLHSMARNPKVWGEDAAEFQPERWTKGLRTFDQYQFPNFNVNPRRCLGMNFAIQEAKIFALFFLRNFTFEQLEGHRVVVKPGVIRNMQNGLPIELRARK